MHVMVRGKCRITFEGTIFVTTRDGRKITVLGGRFKSVYAPESTVKEMRRFISGSSV